MVSPPDKRKLGKNRAKAKQSSNVKLPIHFSVNEELLRKGFLNFFVGTLLNYRRYVVTNSIFPYFYFIINFFFDS